MTNWEGSQLYFKNYESTYLCMDEDIFELQGVDLGISSLYRISINIVCYDHDRKDFKQHLPELFWNTTYISIPPSGSLNQYWIFRKKEYYHILERDKRGLAKVYDEQEELWDKIGLDYKYLFKIFTWFCHFLNLNISGYWPVSRYKKPYLRAVLNEINPRYDKTIYDCVGKIYEINYKNIEMGV